MSIDLSRTMTLRTRCPIRYCADRESIGMSAFAAGSMRTSSWRDGLRLTVPGGFNDAIG